MFGAALGLAEPWRVTSVEFDQEAGRLDLGLDFPRGARFRCPEPGCAKAACAVHDTAEKTWRHLDFFAHQAFMPARVPRVAVPRARRASGGGAVGAAGQRVHVAVRGGNVDLRQAAADRAVGPTGPRA